MNRYIRLGLFAAAGVLAGLAWYYLFGCSGNCGVTSSPWMTMGYVGVIGGLLGMVTEKKKEAA